MGALLAVLIFVVQTIMIIARTYKDAPNVDGFLFIQTSQELMTGDFVRAKITGSYEYDLIGEIDDEFTK